LREEAILQAAMPLVATQWVVVAVKHIFVSVCVAFPSRVTLQKGRYHFLLVVSIIVQDCVSGCLIASLREGQRATRVREDCDNFFVFKRMPNAHESGQVNRPSFKKLQG